MCARFKMKNVLGLLYGLRPITIILFLAAPKTVINITLFAALFGLSGASTVSPVSGMINKSFGAVKLATLYGFVLFIHQIGGFLGAWLGGLCFSATGNYDAIWVAGVLLSALAAGISFMIKEE